MSAGAVGADLLSEVHEESLASLLADVRAYCHPQPRSVTGLSELDNIIDSFRYSAREQTPGHAPDTLSDSIFPSEDDFDLDHREDHGNTTPTWEPRRFRSRKPRPLTINILNGAYNSYAAAQHLIYHLIATSVLSDSHSGKQSSVIYLDCTSSFSATSLYKTILECLRKENAALSATHHSLAKDGLTHVHQLRCASSHSLLNALRELPASLFEIASESRLSPDRPVSLLVINGINTFHWQDRFDTEIARLENVNAGTGATIPGSVRPSEPESLASQIMTELKSLQATLECTVIYTTSTSSAAPAPTVNTTSLHPRHPDDTSPLPPSANDDQILDIYARNALLVLRPSRAGVAQFAPAMSLGECLRDREKRAEAVKNAGYWFGAGPGGLSERRNVSSARNAEVGFGMRVGAEGIVSFE